MARDRRRASLSLTEIHAALSDEFPQAFPRKGRRPPLHDDILDELHEALEGAVDRARLRCFLFMWTRSPDYLAGVADGAPRVDLHGRPVGHVDPRQAGKAAARLARRVPGVLGGPRAARGRQAPARRARPAAGRGGR